MAKRTTRIIAVFLLLVLSSGLLLADEPTAEPLPYSEEEFPDWAHSLRRAEIIAFGSYPVSYLAVYIGFGLYRFLTSSEDLTQLDPRYLPKPFNITGSSVPYTQEETIGVILASAGVSLILSLVDFFIEESRVQEEEDVLVIDYRQGLNPDDSIPNEPFSEREEGPVVGPRIEAAGSAAGGGE